MPTGYTAMLDNPKLTTAKWVTEGLARAFGVCVILRDDDRSLSEEQIEASLKEHVESSTRYCKEKLREAVEALAKLGEDQDKFWVDEYASTVKRMRKHNERSMKEANKTKLRHQQAENDLIKLRDETTDEITRNIANYGLEQLKLVESETKPYTFEILSLEQFKADKLASLNHDIEYYTKQIKETEEREKGRMLAYQTLKAEVKRILDSKEAS